MKLSEVFSRKILNFKQLFPPPRDHFFILITLTFFLGYFCSRSDAKDEHLRMHFIDVGYGDAILIELPEDRHIMVDAGEKKFAAIVVDYLRSMNVESLHAAVISHPHINHFEGFFDILESISIERLYINGDGNSEVGYESLLENFRKKNIPIEILRRGDTLADLPREVRLEVWHPQELSSTPNGNSTVLWLKHNDVSFLLMADIDSNAQNELIDLYPSMQTADVIKVPHHGGPLSDILLRAFTDKIFEPSGSISDRRAHEGSNIRKNNTTPRIFVISTGPNRWGLPRDIDLESLNGAIYRTDVHGTIVLESDGSSVSVKTSQ